MNNVPVSPVLLAQGGSFHGGHPTLSAGMRLDGTVTALDRDGNFLVRTTQGVLALPASPNLVVGAHVTLELVPIGSGLGARLISIAPAEPTTTPNRPFGPAEVILPQIAATESGAPPTIGFPALAEALARLDAHAPGLALQAVHALPGGGGDFVSALLSAMGALRRSDIGALLGQDAARRLDRVTREALRRELSGVERDTAQDAGEPWRTLLVPVLDGGTLGQLGLFVRRHPVEGEAPDSRHPVRFLVETSPSAIGPLQIDGFLIERRLDLILRSHKALPNAWHDDIRALYAEALDALGLSGGIVFQVMPRFPVSGLGTLHAASHAALTA